MSSKYDNTGIGLTPQCAACPFFLPAGSKEEGTLRATSPTAFRAPYGSVLGFCTWGVALKLVYGPVGRKCQKDPAAAPGERIGWPKRSGA